MKILIALNLLILGACGGLLPDQPKAPPVVEDFEKSQDLTEIAVFEPTTDLDSLCYQFVEFLAAYRIEYLKEYTIVSRNCLEEDGVYSLDLEFRSDSESLTKGTLSYRPEYQRGKIRLEDDDLSKADLTRIEATFREWILK